MEGRAFHLPSTSSTVSLRITTSNHGLRTVARPSSGLFAHILCVGEALLDCIATDKARGWTVEEMTRDDSYWTAFPGGANANVATACAKLGTSAAFLGCVGDDADGDLLEGVLQDAGVNVEWLQRSSKLPTRRVMVTRSLQGDREFGGFHQGRKAQEFADCELEWDAIPRSSDDLLESADWIVTGTLSLAFPTIRQTLETLLDQAPSTTKLYVDINWRPVFWPQYTEEEARQRILEYAQRADLVKMTEEEAEWLLGIPALQALEDPAQVKKAFPRAMGVFVTAGEKGAAYSFLGQSGTVGPFAVNVRETTGAGDAFTAGILHRIVSAGGLDCLEEQAQEEDSESSTVQRLVQFAAAVGALTCTQEGAIAAQPTLAQVDAFLLETSC